MTFIFTLFLIVRGSLWFWGLQSDADCDRPIDLRAFYGIAATKIRTGNLGDAVGKKDKCLFEI